MSSPFQRGIRTALENPVLQAALDANAERRVSIRREAFASLPDAEALRQRARIVEVPVTFLTRRGGESKKPKSMRYAWHFSKAIGKTWLR